MKMQRTTRCSACGYVYQEEITAKSISPSSKNFLRSNAHKKLYITNRKTIKGDKKFIPLDFLTDYFPSSKRPAQQKDFFSIICCPKCGALYNPVFATTIENLSE